MKNVFHTTIVLAWVTACAADPGTRPHDMSQAGHEQAAQAEEAKAAQYDQECTPQPGVVCWTDESDQAAEAQRHRELAAEHRAASQALVQAEEQACAGISEDDRDTSPFAHSADIISVTELRHDAHGEGYAGSKEDRLFGATVRFRAVPGMTAEWLQRLMDCHAARNASMGYKMEEMEFCPLMVPGAKAEVHSAHGAFDVNVTANDSTGVKEIVARASAFR